MYELAREKVKQTYKHIGYTNQYEDCTAIGCVNVCVFESDGYLKDYSHPFSPACVFVLDCDCYCAACQLEFTGFMCFQERLGSQFGGWESDSSSVDPSDRVTLSFSPGCQVPQDEWGGFSPLGKEDDIPCRRMRSGSYVKAMAEDDSGDSDGSPKPSPKIQARRASYLKATQPSLTEMTTLQ